jgi:hypothetical protein
MSNHIQEMQELEREMMRIMQHAAKRPGAQSAVYGNALKKIVAAKKSGDMQDILKAYDIVLDLGYQPSQRESDDIAIVIDALAFYSGRFVTVRARNNGELLTQVCELDTLENDLIQHYVRKWGVQACYQSKPDNDAFWQAWGVVYELAIQYRCEVQAQVIKRLFAVHGRNLNIRKVG